VKGIAVGLIVAAWTLPGCTSTPNAAEPERAPITVSFGRAEFTDVSTPFEAGGVVHARSSAAIASRIMAPITAVLVRPGDRVRRGAPLVTLDAREITAAGARASAAFDAARQSADAAASDTQAAEAGLRIARLTRDRIAELHEKRSATPQELDQANASLSAAEAQLGGAIARAAAADATRRGAQAAMQEAQIAASYTVLTAPFDGLITERSVDPGTMATPGVPLLTLEDSATFRLEVRLDEARAAQVALGQTADVSVGDTAATWSPAKVVEVARLDAASHGFVVKIELPDAARARSGQFGRAHFPGPARRTLTVPAAAVVHRGQLTFVFVAEADTVARLRPISVGTRAADRIEVLAGVHDGDRVVTNSPPSLSDGSRIAGDRR
jgi:RND family efflux transporter MFP subunit